MFLRTGADAGADAGNEAKSSFTAGATSVTALKTKQMN